MIFSDCDRGFIIAMFRRFVKRFCVARGFMRVCAVRADLEHYEQEPDEHAYKQG